MTNHETTAAHPQGFTGIRDGLGRDELTVDFESLGSGAQLIALVGPNGSGKTTIIDNAQPYRLMPSRATSASVGGFSYYDHLCAPEGCKNLEWAHEGRRFRSQLVFRIHAQNRRQLSAYRPSEVKGLLVELLGLEQIRAAGQNAGRVVAQLQQALEQQRAALARHRALEQSVQQMRGLVEEAQVQVRSAAERKTTAQASLPAQQQLAQRDVERAAAAGVETLLDALADVFDTYCLGEQTVDAVFEALHDHLSAADRARHLLERLMKQGSSGVASGHVRSFANVSYGSDRIDRHGLPH